MGTTAHLAIVDAVPATAHAPENGAAVLEAGMAHLRMLERRWSRFLPDSEISALNRHAGRPVVVSPETFDLVARAVAGWRATGGRFDPTVGAALAAYGYDRDFADVAAAIAPVAQTAPAPGLTRVELLDECNAVRLPEGATFDPGGIGKGFAADLTAAAMLQAGAAGVLVNVGGDLRVLGEAPSAEGWVITVPDPLANDRELLRLAIAGGAVATSSRLQRRWRTAAGDAHHLIDPRSGRPAADDVVAVTVVAGEAWWAEALTKALFLSGPAGLGDFGDIHAVLVMADGARHATGDLEATLR
jgi:thiamine biosynthesis lipoprotein